MIKIPLNYQINKKRTTQKQKKKKKPIKMMEYTSNNLQNAQDISQNFTNCPPKLLKSTQKIKIKIKIKFQFSFWKFQV